MKIPHDADSASGVLFPQFGHMRVPRRIGKADRFWPENGTA
jgi:hypothetical protein